MSLKADIDVLVSKFSADLEALVRVAAVHAVQSVLGGSSGARALPTAAPSARKKPGPAPKAAKSVGTLPAAGAPERATAPKPTAAKGAKRVRRTVEEIAKLGQSIADYVAKNPGSNAETIKASLKIPGNQWGLSIGWALDNKKLTRKGEKRAAVYSPAGGAAIAKPAPVPPIKRAGK